MKKVVVDGCVDTRVFQDRKRGATDHHRIGTALPKEVLCLLIFKNGPAILNQKALCEAQELRKEAYVRSSRFDEGPRACMSLIPIGK